MGNNNHGKKSINQKNKILSCFFKATIGYGDKCPATYIGKMITSCLCICGVAFWTLPSGIIGSGFALKVEQKKREKQFNRLVPAAAILIQNWWRLVACRRPDLSATWKIYRVERKRTHKTESQTNSPDTVHNNNFYRSLRFRNGQTNLPLSPNFLPTEKISWRKVEKPDDLDTNQCIAIRMIRVIKYHVAKRKFRQAHKPYDFKDIMDENAQGNMKVMYALADIQRRLDQTLGLSKSYPSTLSDRDRESLTLNGKVQRLEIKLNGLEKQITRVVHLLEGLNQHSHHDNEGSSINFGSNSSASGI